MTRSTPENRPKYPYFTDKIDVVLAADLSAKIKVVYPDFSDQLFCQAVQARINSATFHQRILIIAEELQRFLPAHFVEAWGVLACLLGPVNPRQTGMFTDWYWLMPVAKYVEIYGINHPNSAYEAIAEITKRNTGEFAIRPYIRAYPQESLEMMRSWALSPDFHLRRLSSEGLRPRLPWATKLDIFRDNPQPVFEILELLKEDEILFVKRSVANHLTDWLRVNPSAVRPLIAEWRMSDSVHTRWIIRRATRKIS